jgi:hypothetical protein
MDLSALGIPAILLALWSLWNIAVYGAPHLTESSKRVLQTFQVSHVLVFITFFAGVFGAPLVAWRWTATGSRPRFLLWVLASAGLALFLANPVWGGFHRSEALLLSTLAMGGAMFFGELTTVARDSRVPSDRFLLAWLLLGSVQMVYVMQWVAARYFLTILPPTVFLLYRRLELRHGFQKSRRDRAVAGLIAATALLGAAAAVGDALQAQTSRWIARDLDRDAAAHGGGKSYFLGDSFTASGDLLKSRGWIPAFEETMFFPGDRILYHEVSMPRWWFRPGRRPLRPLAVYDYPSVYPLRLMDNARAAGFYASAWGPLPFAISRGSLERYTVFEVTAPCRGDGRLSTEK